MRANRSSAVALIAAFVTVACAVPAWCQAYPNRTIQLIVAYAAGGTGDIVARSISDRLGAALGQSVVVENRAGASGAIGAHSVTTAAPDGYTLLVGQTGEVAVNQHWLKGLNYDPDKDLIPIALAAVVPLALVVPSKASYSTLSDFLTALKAKAQDHIRLCRNWDTRPFRRRVAQAEIRPKPHARALQRGGPRA
jgi:tripartite-type tricarboxylate transporter receptor subunit TctC